MSAFHLRQVESHKKPSIFLEANNINVMCRTNDRSAA